MCRISNAIFKLFKGRTDQFIFIQFSIRVTKNRQQAFSLRKVLQSTTHFWSIPRDKIECGRRSDGRIPHTEGFPVTIIPSFAYLRTIAKPICVGSWTHPWTIIDRNSARRNNYCSVTDISLWVLTWNADFAERAGGFFLVGVVPRRFHIHQTKYHMGPEFTWERLRHWVWNND